MVDNTQNYWILRFIHRPVFWTLENTTFRKVDLFLSSGERGNTYSVTYTGPRF
jgi:hypothetical protein